MSSPLLNDFSGGGQPQGTTQRGSKRFGISTPQLVGYAVLCFAVAITLGILYGYSGIDTFTVPSTSTCRGVRAWNPTKSNDTHCIAFEESVGQPVPPNTSLEIGGSRTLTNYFFMVGSFMILALVMAFLPTKFSPVIVCPFLVMGVMTWVWMRRMRAVSIMLPEITEHRVWPPANNATEAHALFDTLPLDTLPLLLDSGISPGFRQEQFVLCSLTVDCSFHGQGLRQLLSMMMSLVPGVLCVCSLVLYFGTADIFLYFGDDRPAYGLDGATSPSYQSPPTITPHDNTGHVVTDAPDASDYDPGSDAKLDGRLDSTRDLMLLSSGDNDDLKSTMTALSVAPAGTTEYSHADAAVLYAVLSNQHSAVSAVVYALFLFLVTLGLGAVASLPMQRAFVFVDIGYEYEHTAHVIGYVAVACHITQFCALIGGGVLFFGGLVMITSLGMIWLWEFMRWGLSRIGLCCGCISPTEADGEGAGGPDQTAPSGPSEELMRDGTFAEIRDAMEDQHASCCACLYCLLQSLSILLWFCFGVASVVCAIVLLCMDLPMVCFVLFRLLPCVGFSVYDQSEEADPEQPNSAAYTKYDGVSVPESEASVSTAGTDQPARQIYGQLKKMVVQKSYEYVQTAINNPIPNSVPAALSGPYKQMKNALTVYYLFRSWLVSPNVSTFFKMVTHTATPQLKLTIVTYLRVFLWIEYCSFFLTCCQVGSAIHAVFYRGSVDRYAETGGEVAMYYAFITEGPLIFILSLLVTRLNIVGHFRQWRQVVYGKEATEITSRTSPVARESSGEVSSLVPRVVTDLEDMD